MTTKDTVGYTLSGGNAHALDLLEQALHQFRCFADNPLATAEAALAEAPDLVMAQVLRAWLYLLSSEAAAVAPAREALAAARELPHNEREAWHLRAIAQLCDGHWRAAALTLEDLSVHYPLDALALQAGQQLDFFVGDARMLRDRIARALPAWSATLPGWHAVLGMQAFGLEETGDYARAERLGRQAVDLQPRDAWAQHAVAHVLEMQGRRDEGIEWMRGNEGWQTDNFLAVHNWWHLALFHIEFDLNVIAGLMAVIGYSLNDSIVISDRLRDLLGSRTRMGIHECSDVAIKATFSRTMITSGTTLFTVGALLLFGGDALYGFSFTLFAGILVGTISSITVASTVQELLGLSPQAYQKKEEELAEAA